MEKASVNITIALDTMDEADILYRSIKPELSSNKPGGRTSTGLGLNKREISLHIDAKDISSLRATIGTYFRWMQVGRSI